MYWPKATIRARAAHPGDSDQKKKELNPPKNHTHKIALGLQNGSHNKTFAQRAGWGGVWADLQEWCAGFIKVKTHQRKCYIRVWSICIADKASFL